jgi:hypothetical protein
MHFIYFDLIKYHFRLIIFKLLNSLDLFFYFLIFKKKKFFFYRGNSAWVVALWLVLLAIGEVLMMKLFLALFINEYLSIANIGGQQDE